MKKIIIGIAIAIASVNSRADIVCHSSGRTNGDGVIAVYISTKNSTASFGILREDTMQLTGDFGWYNLGTVDDIQITGNRITGNKMDLVISNTASTAKACQIKRDCKEAFLTAQTSIKVTQIEKLKVHCSSPAKVKQTDILD